MPVALGATPKDLIKEWQPVPALKVCITTGLNKKETEKAGIIIRHAVTTVMKGKKWQRGTAAPMTNVAVASAAAATTVAATAGAGA
jgi:serine palmitoyltransferase